jgi:hypothetical protein
VAAALIHHTRKDGSTERGSSALRGAGDVMIECKKSEYENIVLLKCTKAKDAEPFADIEVGLEKIAFPNGRSSLVARTPPSLLNRVFKSTAPYRFVCGPTMGPSRPVNDR